MSRKYLIRTILCIFAVIAAAFYCVSTTRANVYATNIKLNGGTTNISAASGTGATITYILNEPATRGVTVNILAGSNIVRSINLAGGGAGALKGTNSVVWDGKDGNSNNLGGGIYNINITASATGFTNWTRTSTDSNASSGYYVFSPRGIAVNTNPNSFYYGRVFVGNAKTTAPTNIPGNVDGVLKLNADGSFADEGQSTGGYTWIDDAFDNSPQYLRYGQDDRIYALDFTASGQIVALDMAMTTNQIVFGPNNYANNTAMGANGWGMMDVTDAGTSKGLLWLGDNDLPDSSGNGAGVWVWHMTNGVADPNDTVGTQAITVTAGSALDQEPTGGFMTDENSNIFVSQLLSDSDTTSPVTMEFTNWDGMTPLTNGTAWQAGTNDTTFDGVYDTALSSRANPLYVAYALSAGSGGIRVLYASNGVVVTNVTTGQVLTNLDAPNQFFGVAWDAVGNLYGVSATLQRWRVYSPPGTNQATTVAVPTFTVIAPVVIKFTSIAVNNSTVTLTFTGSASDPPSAFTLLSSAAATGPWGTASATITSLNPGVFQATTATSGPTLFYRVKR